MEMVKSGRKLTTVDEMDENGSQWMKWMAVDGNGCKWMAMD